MVQKAVEDGLLSSAAHFNAVSKLLRQEGVDQILRGLVQASAVPLSAIERDFAIDSTGFARGTYGSYRETRYGAVRDRKWVKLHAICGVRTNIIADAVATDAPGSDSPYLRDLVPGAARMFDLREVSGDKAYSGKANLWVIHHVGATPLIPFKGGKSTPKLEDASSAYQGAPGYPGSAKLWRRAYHYFALHQEEFYRRYHKRSNVEATFGAIKAWFGERLKSKTPEAQLNEVLCRAVAWNICVLVRAMHEYDGLAEISAA